MKRKSTGPQIVTIYVARGLDEIKVAVSRKLKAGCRTWFEIIMLDNSIKYPDFRLDLRKADDHANFEQLLLTAYQYQRYCEDWASLPEGKINLTIAAYVDDDQHVSAMKWRTDFFTLDVGGLS